MELVVVLDLIIAVVVVALAGLVVRLFCISGPYGAWVDHEREKRHRRAKR